MNNGEANNSARGDRENKTDAYLWQNNDEHSNRNRRKRTNNSEDSEKEWHTEASENDGDAAKMD